MFKQSLKILSENTVKNVIEDYMPETFTTLLLKNKLRDFGYFATQNEVSNICLKLVDTGDLTSEVDPNWETYSAAQFNLYTKVEEVEVDLEDYLSVTEITKLLAQGIDVSGLVVTKKNF